MSLKNKATTALLAALAGTMLPLAVQAQTALLNDTDYTDVWWNPQRSGWGMNLVQQQNAAYVSLHDYKVDGTPTWYTAPLTRRADGSFAGDVYRQASAPVSAPLTVNQVSGTPIGNFVFTPVSPSQGKIIYTIDGQQGEQTITRFTFVPQPFEIKDHWDDKFVSWDTPCATPDGIRSIGDSSYRRLYSSVPTFTQTTQEPDGTTTVTLDTSAGCSITGTLVMTGRFGRLDNARHVCTGATAGVIFVRLPPTDPIPAQVTLESSPSRLEVRWTTDKAPAYPNDVSPLGYFR